MKKKIDCTGLQCPAPVLKTREILEDYPVSRMQVIVDNDAAAENVSRFLDFSGFSVSVDSDGIRSVVTGTKDPSAASAMEPEPAPDAGSAGRKVLVVVTASTLGRGDDDLGGKLMVNYIKTLNEMGKDLWRLIFLNHGVRLCTRDSQAVEDLRALEASGVSILVCGTCLTHLDLMEEKAVGQTTNMLDVVTSMQLADSVITL